MELTDDKILELAMMAMMRYRGRNASGDNGVGEIIKKEFTPELLLPQSYIKFEELNTEKVFLTEVEL